MSSIELAPKTFNYNSIGDQKTRSDMRKKAATGKQILKRTAQGVWQMGELLADAKERLPHGQFMDWCEAEFGLSHSSACNFMAVHKAFKFPNFGNLEVPVSVLYMLAAPGVDDDTRSEIVGQIEAGEVRTVADAKAVLHPNGSAPKPTPRPALRPENTSQFQGGDEVEWTDSDGQSCYGVYVAPAAGKPGGAIVKLQGAGSLGTGDVLVKESDLRPADYDTADSVDPFDDSDEPASAPPATSPAASEPEPARHETVVYDTLSNHQPAPDENDLTDEEWLQIIPLYRVQSAMGNKGILTRRDLLSYRTLAQSKVLSSAAHHARRTDTFKAGGNSPLAQLVAMVVALSHPREWFLHAPCKGGGCNRCGYAGYDLAAGIPPVDVESGRVQL